MNLTRAGALAAWLAALTYLVGFALFLTRLAPLEAAEDFAAITAFTAENARVMSAWYLTIYVLNGICLVVIATALGDRLRADAPGAAQVQRAFGYVWATLVIAAGMVANVGIARVAALYPTDPAAAERLWATAEFVEAGIGGGNEVAGGVWAIAAALAFWRARGIWSALAVYSLVVGLAGLLTLLPGAAALTGAVFGFGYIGWFVWVGVALWRG